MLYAHLLYIGFALLILIYPLHCIQHNPLAKAGERCWDTLLNRFFVGTSTCANVYNQAVCDAMFPADFEGNRRRVEDGLPPIASDRCEVPELREHALKCPNNCYACCETPRFNCSNPRTSANFNCDAKVDKCEDPLWRDIMLVKCRRTCGLCNYEEPTGGECADVDEFCTDKDIYFLCTDARVSQRMEKLCPKTCNACDGLKEVEVVSEENQPIDQ